MVKCRETKGNAMYRSRICHGNRAVDRSGDNRYVNRFGDARLTHSKRKELAQVMHETFQGITVAYGYRMP